MEKRCQHGEIMGTRIMGIFLESGEPWGALLGAPHPMAQTLAVLC